MATLDLFRNDSSARAFTAGQRLLEEGSGTHDEMFVVVSGEVDIVGGDVVLETVGPGGIFGEMALVDQQPRSAGAIAKTDGSLVPVTQKRFEYLISNTPFFAIEVMRVMTRRLRHMNEVR